VKHGKDRLLTSDKVKNESYHHGERGDTVVDTQQLDEDIDKIQKY